jgi:hypothetical protein
VAPKHDLVETEVVVRCPAGHPLVLRCHPLLRDRVEPFPTLYWLVCDVVAAQIARLEYAGGVAAIERRIAEDPALRARVHADHDAYVAERWSLLAEEERVRAEEAGVARALRERGIGGIANRSSVKCLHLHYAHHLVRGSAIGEEIERLGDVVPCPARAAP